LTEGSGWWARTDSNSQSYSVSHYRTLTEAADVAAGGSARNDQPQRSRGDEEDEQDYGYDFNQGDGPPMVNPLHPNGPESVREQLRSQGPVFLEPVYNPNRTLDDFQRRKEYGNSFSSLT